MRVLMCGSDFSVGGGITSVCKQLLEYKWSDNTRIDYVPTYKPGSMIRETAFFLAARREIKQRLASGLYDLVHIHMSFNGSFLRKYQIYKLCKHEDVPCVLHMHGSEFKRFYDRAPVPAKQRIVGMLEGVHAVIALGESWANYYLSIAPQSKVVIIPNGVIFHGVRERERHSVFTTLFLGGLVARKGASDLLKAFARFSKSHKGDKFKLLLAGDGEERERLESEARALEIADSVEFLGWIDANEREDSIARADVFALPSYNEGLPMSLLETMSKGVPPIISNVGSISEAIHDGVEGLLIKPGAVDEIAACLEKFYLDVDLWSNCSMNSMKAVEKKYNESILFKRLGELYASTSARLD